MGYQIRKWVSRLLLGGLFLCLYLMVDNSKPAMASVHTYPEGSGQVMYRSLQSLRDGSDNAWQAILFKRIKSGQVDDLHLRLVGFPGITELAHPSPLQITTGTEKAWTAVDVLVGSSLPNNVGEYDLLQVMTQLDKNTPLRLSLPLKSQQIVDLLVPPFAVQEWRQVFDMK